jgi:hypothetical protein
VVEIDHLRRLVGEPLITTEGDDLNDAARLSMRICHDRFHLHPEKAFATFEVREDGELGRALVVLWREPSRLGLG